MRNPMILLAVMLLFSATITSCVSSKKHKASLAEMERLNARATEAEREKAALKGNLSKAEKEMEVLRSLVEKNERLINDLIESINAELTGYDKDDVKVEIRDGKAYITFANKLLYPSGSAEIDAKGKSALKKVADIVKKNPELQILVEGHTDPRPIRTHLFQDNWDLSVARSTNVVRELVQNGVAPSNVIAAGRAEFHPVAQNFDDQGRQLNRRTEIIIAPNLSMLYELIKGRES